MELNRTATEKEMKLIELLIDKSNLTISGNWKEGLLVRPMNDDGMGSLLLFPYGKIIDGRLMGEQVSDFQFKDIDGIDVIASLNLDSEGNLFELDMWKTDFSKLLKFPEL